MPSYVYVPVPTPGLLKVAHSIEQNLHKQQPKTCRGTRRNLATEGRLKGVNRFFRGCLQGIGSSDTIYVVIHGTGLSGMEFVGGDRNAKSEAATSPPDNLLRPLAQVPDLKSEERPASAFKKYTAEALAKAMEKEGLSKSHRLIELLACGAGLIDNLADRQREIAARADYTRSYFSKEVEAAVTPKNKAALQDRVELRVAGRNAPIAARHQKMDQNPSLKVAFGERFFDALVALGYVGIQVRAYAGDIKAVATPLKGRGEQPFSVETAGVGKHPDSPNMRASYGAKVMHP